VAQCLKWSKKEAGSLPQSEVKCRNPNPNLSAKQDWINHSAKRAMAQGPPP